MKLSNIKFGITLLISVFVFTARAQVGQKVSNWPQGITYEIFVQSFADSDGDGIGDINGMTEKLDYIKDLGAEGIWLMPINPSNSYHKYNVDDYYNIHPDYGTLDDFKNFINEAHKRGIRVVIDLVVNHSGDKNIWFQEALKDEDSKYWDYYVWAHKDDPKVQPPVSADGRQRRWRSNWNKVEGSDYYYFSHFSPNMPDLNYDNPKLQQEIFKVGRFWLEEVGIDGFRLDAARHIFPDHRAIDNHAWWEYFLKEMQKVKEDVYIVGEVWAQSDIVAPFLKGIPALFNFDMGGAIIKAVNEENANEIITKHKEIIDYYKTVNPDYIDCTFLTNHDQNRILSSVGNNINKAKIAAALLFTLPGSPYVYYGEEIGMLGEKPDQFIREPFIWSKTSTDKFRTTWEEPRFSVESAVTPMQDQLKDENSLLNHYKSFIKLRNSSSALTYGDLTPVDVSNPVVSAFVRADEKESLLVMHNLSAENQVFSLPENVKEFTKSYFTDAETNVTNARVEIPAYGTLILQK